MAKINVEKRADLMIQLKRLEEDEKILKHVFCTLYKYSKDNVSAFVRDNKIFVEQAVFVPETDDERESDQDIGADDDVAALFFKK